LKLNKVIEKSISDIVGCLTDQIIVFPGGWGDSLPEWLKNTITLERLAESMRVSKGGEATGTDAEACVYLYTACLTAPMDHDWSQIYLYVAGKTYKRWNKGEMPNDIRVESPNDQQMADMNRLKSWIYDRQIKARKERGRTEREQKDAETKALNEQPELFTF
jgi:hypothetical protein